MDTTEPTESVPGGVAVHPGVRAPVGIPGRVRGYLYRAVGRATAALFSLALPLAVLAQATRLLPLLVATGLAHRATAVLAGGGAMLVAITLGPAVYAVGVALAVTRLRADGALQLLAIHGVPSDAVAASLRSVALAAGMAVLAAGVLGEPPLARAMRHAVADLGALGLAGTLRHGGQVEPLPGLVLAAPAGTRGGVYIARGVMAPDGTMAVDGGITTVTASGFTVATQGTHISLALRNARVMLPDADGLTVTAARARVRVSAPAAAEDIVAEDLTPGVNTRESAPLRRHAARALWGVLTYAVAHMAAALALWPWRTAARGVVVSAVVPVVVLVLLARVGAVLVARAQGLAGIGWATGCTAATAVLLAELLARGVARWQARVL